jgi:uncharacterized integral membrane protein (TIGR00697 family)
VQKGSGISQKNLWPYGISRLDGVSRLENSSGYKFLALMSMLYMSIMLCNAVLTNRYIGTDKFFILGGTLTSPFIFILDNIIAEIYGYRIILWVIFAGYSTQALFVLICQLVVIAPAPIFFKEKATYVSILGPSLLQITVSGFAAYIIANVANSYIITRWKVLLKGRKFWLRSVGSSIFAEGLYSFIAIMMMEIPASFFVGYLKKSTGIDTYEFPLKFTPFDSITTKEV